MNASKTSAEPRGLDNATNRTMSDMEYFKAGKYYNISVMIWRIFPAIIIPVGTMGNVLTIIVLLRQRHGMTSTALFLFCLAVSDLIILYGSPLNNFMTAMWKTDIRASSDSVCKIHSYFSHVSPQLSSWLLVAVTLERVLCVMIPHRVKSVCTKRGALIFVLTIVVFIMVLNSHFFYGAGLMEDTRQHGSYPCRPKYESYAKFSEKVWPWIDFGVYFAAPFALITTANILIIIKLAITKRQRRRLYGCNGNVTPSDSRGNKNITFLLFSLCAMFCVFLAPVSVYFIGSPNWIADILSQSDPWAVQYDMEYLGFWFTITNCVSYLNATCNFLLYVLSGSKFRKEIVKLFHCKKSSTDNLFK